jgi:1-deoxy-D-xylulose-5-phosphate synthase
MGSAILEFMVDNGYAAQVRRLGIPDKLIEHGTQEELWAECHYDMAAMIEAAMDLVGAKRGVLSA